MRRCYELLESTSRSFYAVIMNLDPELKPAICIFYLVLRGLDTIEDDMTLDVDYKSQLLRDFYKVLEKDCWNFTQSGENQKDRILLVEFDCVIREFCKLKKAYQEVIISITKQMAEGMIYYAAAIVETLEDWDKYCYHVAGLVGIGLSKIFSVSGLEDESVGSTTELSIAMGLFLQKTNIIRDFLEDFSEGRIFWPSSVWKKYAKRIEDFKNIRNKQEALQCLNELITNTLKHVPQVLGYLNSLQNQSVFNFCAIPQVMAITTLALCYNNYSVFTGCVKIRKGLAVKLMTNTTTPAHVQWTFFTELKEIYDKTDQEPMANAETMKVLKECFQLPMIAPLLKKGRLLRLEGNRPIIFCLLFVATLILSVKMQQ
ncbi:squalene synthase-like [Zophobas morio]|uniref:squalene synthase-like n=1 Tax=Zophobas morio TaxID=2755281 RepID=UPI0030830F0C